MDGQNWADNLALRGTYVITGNSPIPGTAASFDILTAQRSGFFPGGTGLTISTVANSKLTWERTSTINFGIDFSMLRKRIGGSIDLYRKKTVEMLGLQEVNSFTGSNFITGNFGDMENKGVELTLRSSNIAGKNFIWNSFLVMAYNKNTITKLNSLFPIT